MYVCMYVCIYIYIYIDGANTHNGHKGTPEWSHQSEMKASVSLLRPNKPY